jgi:phosphonate transport system substrate-binding protein
MPTVAPTANPRAGWPAELTLGLFAGDDQAKTLDSNQPVIDFLSKKLGIPIKWSTGTSYSAVIEAMRAKKVDGMAVGPFSYLLAVQEANAEAIAVEITTRGEVYDPKLTEYYFSCISTKKGKGIKTVQDLKGKSFSFVDPASTSGQLVPKTLLKKLGIDPDKDMKPIFAGSHPSSIIALWNDKVDASASTEENLYIARDEKQIEFAGFPDNVVGKVRTEAEIAAQFESAKDGQIAIIRMSDPIPQTPFNVRADLPATLKTALQEALLSTKDDAEFIKKTKRWFTNPTQKLGLKNLDAFYNPLREIAKELQLDLKAMK